ncbi:hypothetical protein HAX54_036692 [Datura stramonium]|uniref:Uncharacterized protein n=1 Tax=Datura stramonium TaxID=4076 RepID=A0ABS8VK16_DATST|nr:hypothetical protein [Datura stramonium]
MKVYQFPDPVVAGVEAYTPTNQDDFDDSSSTPSVLEHKRPNPDVGPSIVGQSKRLKYEVDNQFTDICKLIHNHFVKVMETIKAKSHSNTKIFDFKGANSEVPPNMMDGSNERRGDQHITPKSGNESGDTVKATSIEEIHEGDEA